MAIASASTVAATLPVFLVGALAVQLTRDLQFGTTALGLAVGIAQATRSATALLLSRFVDQLGASRSLRIAVSAAAASGIGVATMAQSWSSFVAWLMLGAAAHALIQPAANRYMVSRVNPERLGTAFGIKQSAPPASTMLAGLSVPLIAVTVGWRWAYVMAAGIALIMVMAVGRRPPPGMRAPKTAIAKQKLRDRPTIVVLAFGFAFSFAASSVIITFYVHSYAAAGGSSGLGGVLFAAASLGVIALRIVAGIACDRFDMAPLRLCAILLGIGSMGYLSIAIGSPVTMALGLFVALMGSWGFPGVFWFALMRAYPKTPGRITGAMAPGVLGGVIGPSVFGFIVDQTGYAAAWGFGFAVAAVAAVIMEYAARRLRRWAPDAA